MAVTFMVVPEIEPVKVPICQRPKLGCATQSLNRFNLASTPRKWNPAITNGRFDVPPGMSNELSRPGSKARQPLRTFIPESITQDDPRLSCPSHEVRYVEPFLI